MRLRAIRTRVLGIGDFFTSLLLGQRAVVQPTPLPTVKVDSPTEIPRPAELKLRLDELKEMAEFDELENVDEIPDVPITKIDSDRLKMLHQKHPDYMYQEFKKLSRNDRDVFNTRSFQRGLPPVILRPENYPAGTTSIIELSDDHMQTIFRDNPAFMLQQFKTLHPVDQATFNAKIQQFKLGDPFIGNNPCGAERPLYQMNSVELKMLYKYGKAFFDQEVHVLPNQVQTKLYAIARPLPPLRRCDRHHKVTFDENTILKPHATPAILYRPWEDLDSLTNIP
jgi:hypothetical protein